VAELTRLVGDLSIGDTTPFVNRKGQMTWPTDGRLLRKFGESKADGRLRWDGVLLATGAGSEVLAVHHGRVVYSDWLPGMGLLVVLEHGDGYLTLYGHNQDLIMEVGEWVTPGTVIAHVGDSGGQPVPGLYFEIRKNGSPVNPSHWVGK
jgi:septal ring factor EnvC (AmiA/AmiB activator)